jgi:exodeoxyribonuclease VII large subunit
MMAKSDERFREHIGSLESGLIRTMRQQIELLRASLREKMRLLGDPRRRLEQYAQRVDELLGRLATGLGYHLRRDRALLISLSGSLEHLNPLGILSRGYSITKKLPEGAVLKDPADVEPGDMISTRLHKGEVWSRVEKIRRGSEGDY